MAEEEGQLKTEEPTPRRREEARKQGQVAFSPELTAAAVIMAGALYLLFMGPATGSRLLERFRGDLKRVPARDFDITQARSHGVHLFGGLLLAAGPLFAVLVVAAVAACVAQVGLRILPDRLTPDFERISVSTGLGRLVSLQSAQRVGLALLKAAVLIAVAVVVIRGRSGTILALSRGSLDNAVASGWELCLRLALYLSGTLFVFGAVDYTVQWRRLERALRMTRQELKEETRREEGDPLIRARIRQIQRQRAQQRLRSVVPRATVVLTNPTHYAVALRYDRGMDKAPVLVAKGAGVMARHIAEIARRHAVPVLERPAIARALYAAVKEGQEIPPGLFRAVAEVIAFVLRLRGAA